MRKVVCNVCGGDWANGHHFQVCSGERNVIWEPDPVPVSFTEMQMVSVLDWNIKQIAEAQRFWRTHHSKDPQKD